jgi:hypothetical protein
MEVLPLAAVVAAESALHFAAVSDVLGEEVIGVLLPEFVLCLTVLHLENPHLLDSIDMTPLSYWLQLLDNFNRIAPGKQLNEARVLGRVLLSTFW